MPTLEVNAPLASASAAISFTEKQMLFDDYVLGVYEDAKLKKAGLSLEVFKKAIIGYQNFKQHNMLAPAKSIITVIDFTKTSRDKRLWIIDLKSKKVLFNTLVAHGRNSGEDKAVEFSNEFNSYKSSMGFYITNKTYFGKHGLSLRLTGMDENYNSNAMERAIVMHGADYVSDSFIKQYGRLGRSLGCPALPTAVTKEVVELIKDNTCLYIHTADKTYASNYLDPTVAVEMYALEMPVLEMHASN
ncbi:murein L,D-transpeptidase catalytic domain family protein [Pontibacter beigongshangensis]|uniref:murein L,D-transpeptidase catalytic domain family protein n=1 Tax=Pontibacter beigongshangensis TaxID=2574733 RepID=UPI001F513CBD|nr:murein L,D-transpeptidase catalytic domain family protein [Pontibacter beigongshangensis]